MIKTHKIRLHPTPEQSVYFAKAAGTARFVWNWGLAEWNRQYEAGEKPTALKLKKRFNAIKREQFPWAWEVTKNASDQPFLDLGKAFTDFFKGQELFNQPPRLFLIRIKESSSQARSMLSDSKQHMCVSVGMGEVERWTISLWKDYGVL